jgi:hypothetical protein
MGTIPYVPCYFTRSKPNILLIFLSFTASRNLSSWQIEFQTRIPEASIFCRDERIQRLLSNKQKHAEITITIWNYTMVVVKKGLFFCPFEGQFINIVGCQLVGLVADAVCSGCDLGESLSIGLSPGVTA